MLLYHVQLELRVLLCDLSLQIAEASFVYFISISFMDQNHSVTSGPVEYFQVCADWELVQSRQNIQTPGAAHQERARFNGCSCSIHQQGAIGFHRQVSHAMRCEVILKIESQLQVHLRSLTWAGWRRRVRRVSRGRRSVSAGPGAPLSPPSPACQARCPPSPETPAPGPGRRAPPGRSLTRSSSVPGWRCGGQSSANESSHRQEIRL